MALTLGQARPILWKYVSNVAYEQAQDSDISNFDLTLNRLCERLFTEGKWRSMYRRITLRTYGNKLTLPRHFATCIGADPICEDGSWTGIPLHIYSHLASNGPALTSDSARACSIRGLEPVSDSAQTLVDPIGTFYLRAKSTKASNRGITLVGGLDQNDAVIEDDVKLEVANGTTTTSQQYTEMPFIEKAITGATVSLYSVDTTTAVETLLCAYEPSETVPAYKRYMISTAGDGNTFACLCKLAFVPAINDADLIIPSVLDALILGLMSFQFRDKNDAERSALYMGPNYPGRGDSTARPLMAGAIDVLDSDKSEDESAEIPMFNISREYGAGNIYQVH